MRDSEGTRAHRRPVAPVWPLGQTEGTDPELRVIDPLGLPPLDAEIRVIVSHDTPTEEQRVLPNVIVGTFDDLDTYSRVPSSAQAKDWELELRAAKEVKATNPKDAVGVRKIPISCVSTAVMSEVGIGMLEGARKYGRHNYRIAGVRASVYLDALWRHIFVQWWEMGEDIDGPSGIHHVSKAIADLMVLRDSMIQENWVDDRPPRSKVNVEDLNAKASHIIDTVRPGDPIEAWTEERVKE